MTWQALVVDAAEHERIARVISEIVTAVDATPTERLDELADRAVLHAYVTGNDDAMGAYLEAAIDAYARAPSMVALFGGAARLAWTFAHVTDAETAAEVCVPIEGALAVHAANATNFDLIRGLVGFGVLALEREAEPLAAAVLARLEQLAQPRGPGCAWHTEPHHMPPWQRESAPDGVWNLGLSHGTPGVIALLARFVARGFEPQRARRLLDGAVAYLLAAEPERASGRFPAWHVGDERVPATGRVAWCYGDLGVAMALYAAGEVRDARGYGIALAAACTDRSLAEAEVRDAAICHGAGGAAHCFHRLYRATGDVRFERGARSWLDHVLALRNGEAIAGFPSALGDPPRWDADGSLLTGAPGVALVLSAMISDVEPAWDRLLLVDV